MVVILLPREWAWDLFSLLLTVIIIRLKISLTAGYHQLTDVTNYRLNNYGYLHTPDIKYAFDKF